MLRSMGSQRVGYDLAWLNNNNKKYQKQVIWPQVQGGPETWLGVSREKWNTGEIYSKTGVESIQFLSWPYCAQDSFPYTEMRWRTGGKGVEADRPKPAIELFTRVWWLLWEKRKVLGEDGVEADPRGKETDPDLEKEPKLEGEAFHLGLEWIFYTSVSTLDCKLLKAGITCINGINNLGRVVNFTYLGLDLFLIGKQDCISTRRIWSGGEVFISVSLRDNTYLTFWMQQSWNVYLTNMWTERKRESKNEWISEWEKGIGFNC